MGSNRVQGFSRRRPPPDPWSPAAKRRSPSWRPMYLRPVGTSRPMAPAAAPDATSAPDRMAAPGRPRPHTPSHRAVRTPLRLTGRSRRSNWQLPANQVPPPHWRTLLTPTIPLSRPSQASLPARTPSQAVKENRSLPARRTATKPRTTVVRLRVLTTSPHRHESQPLARSRSWAPDRSPRMGRSLTRRQPRTTEPACTRYRRSTDDLRLIISVDRSGRRRYQHRPRCRRRASYPLLRPALD